MIKIKFTLPLIELNGKTTTMSMRCRILIGKSFYKEKRFTNKVTLKDGDKYDLNKARTILQTIIERKGYKWAYDIINRQRKVFYENYSECDDFCTKATHIIDHDEKYLETLISK